MINQGVLDLCSDVIHFVSEKYNEDKNKLCIAGGFLRDHYFDLPPKDVDVFVLSKPFKDNGYCLGFSVYHEFEYLGLPVQVIHSSAHSTSELLNEFDWEICNFSFHIHDNEYVIRYPKNDPVCWKDDRDYFYNPAGILWFNDKPLAGLQKNMERYKDMNLLIRTINRGFAFRKRFALKISESAYGLLMDQLSDNLKNLTPKKK